MDATGRVEAQGIGLPDLAMVFVWIGATAFGGMWAATHKLETELVHRKHWLTLEDQQALMGFLSGVGYYMYGLPGAAAAIAGLVIPTWIGSAAV